MTAIKIQNGAKFCVCVITTILILLTQTSAIETQYGSRAIRNASGSQSAPPRTKLTATNSLDRLPKRYGHSDKTDKSIFSPFKIPSKSVTEILRASNSGGPPEVRDKGGTEVEDDKKTLSQQVADGKYGLIQKEIFPVGVKRPGIISYDINPEVPKDNINNLGGLEPDDIWLAENHLLVLGGSGYSKGDATPWKPIDNYVAPNRPIKISPTPKIPPPFPVQLTENGPLIYLKSPNGSYAPPPSIPFFHMFPNDNKFPSFPPFPNDGSQSRPQAPKGSFPFQSPIRPLYPNNSLPPAPPSMYKPLPGAEFIPPFGNLSDSFDEDDPSLFYPAPYDFYYPKDNSSAVPAGPLVPGIVLPPPPDFFSTINTKTIKSKQRANGKARFKSDPYPRKTGKQLPGYSSPPYQTFGTPLQDSTDVPPETTTGITYNDIINDVTYPDIGENKITYQDISNTNTYQDISHINKYKDIIGGKIKYEDPTGRKINPDVQDWIPIPAPKPFYITGPKKPIKDSLVIMEAPLADTNREGYLYDIPRKQLLTIDSDRSKNKATTNQHTSRGSFKHKLVANSNPEDNTRPPNLWDTTPTVTTANMYHPPIQAPDDKAVQATYYFYEEPRYPQNSGYHKDAIYPHSPNYSKDSIVTTTGKPYDIIFEQPIKNVDGNGIYKSQFRDFPYVPTSAAPVTSTEADISNYIEETRYKQRRPKAPILPIYYLAELDHIAQPPAYPSKFTTENPTNVVQQPAFHKPTSKPIFQYSYTATGYEGGNSQIQLPEEPYKQQEVPYQHQVFNNYHPYYSQVYPQRPNLVYQVPVPISTPAPSILSAFGDNSFFEPVKEKYSPIRINDYKPKRPLDEQPWIPKDYNDFIYKTESPFYAFFTKEDEHLIDDNTKQYFSIFGQKIKKNHPSQELRYTSPIPSSSAPTYKWDYYEPRQSKYTKSDRHQPYQTAYSSTTTDSNGRQRHSTQGYPSSLRATHQPKGQHTTASYNYQLEDQEKESTTISLEGDTLVNYISPPATENPDAETIDVQNGLDSGNAATEANLVKFQKIRYSGNQKYEVQDSGENIENFSEELSDETAPDGKRNGNFIGPNNRNLLSSTDGVNQYDSFETAYPDRKIPFRPQNPISLEGDIAVNYKQPRPPVNPNSEYVYPGQGGNQARGSSQRVVSYKLPNVEGHFYFLMPRESSARYQQLDSENNYNFQSDAEKPGGYFKREHKYDKMNNNTTTTTTETEKIKK